MSVGEGGIREQTNLRAILLMVASMVGFAFTDTLIKMASADAGAGQIIVFQGVFGTLLFATLLIRAKERLTVSVIFDKMVVVRTVGDMFAIVCMMTALKLMSVGTVSAIMQTQPLMLTIGAMIFLGERVSWFRWSAIGLGMVGALIIIRPGTSGFDSASLLVVFGVLGLTVRDLATRKLDPRHPTLPVSALATIMIIPAGIGLHIATQSQITWRPDTVALMILSGVAGAISYFAIVLAMRVGEVSAIAPFRYSRLVAAFVIAYLILGERPDWATVAGGGLIVVAGLIVFHRERRMKA